jgi:carbamoyltransferase
MRQRCGPTLGLSPLDKDATACLYVDGRWTAIAEERLSRIKLHAGFPQRAVAELLRCSGIRPADIQHVVYAFMPWWVEGSRIVGGYLRDLPFTATNGTSWKAKLRHLREYRQWCRRSVREHRKYHRELVRELRSLGLDRKLTRIEHHASHASSAFLTSGFEEALALTLDWYGGGLSGSVSRCTAQGIVPLREFRYPHSLGLFYAQVTSALGFKTSRHEGKIVGLAAYGDSGVLGPALLERFVFDNGDLRYRSGMDPWVARDLAQRFPREHIAAGYQHALEVLACEMVTHWTARTGLRDVVLAGGVAANVKMNQRIADLAGVRRISVHPNMGDGGTAMGAILAFLSARGEVESEELATCYLGPAFSEERMEAAMRAAGLKPVRSRSVAEDVAESLADGKVVARFGGAMEYGPRALGNRSILSAATDPGINFWLNERLGRSEFMPFAPVTLFEHRQARYVGIDKSLAAARFMTVTCECTDLMKKESPAAVHVDGTARPQILCREDNPEFYEIVEAYCRITGIPTLINTSFNMHEEPIVCTPEDAVRAFLDGKLDCLSMGPFLARRKSEEDARADMTASRAS